MTEEEQQAHNELVDNELKVLTEAVQDLVRVARQHENRVSIMEDLGQQLVAMQVRADERADRADERMNQFGVRMDSFNARLDRFLENFERYLKGSTNGAGGNGASNS